MLFTFECMRFFFARDKVFILIDNFLTDFQLLENWIFKILYIVFGFYKRCFIVSSARSILPATFIAVVFVTSIGGCLFQGQLDNKPVQEYQAPVVTKTVEPDPELLEMANKDNTGSSQYQTYLTYQKGLGGVTINTLKAKDWLVEAAERGHLESVYLLAEHYAEPGHDVYPFKAIELFTAAAKRGHSKAQIHLANYYLEGYYIEKDYSEAMKWYRSASKQGVSEADYNLGVMYKLGKAVEQSPEKAVSHFRMAAEAGHAAAQFNMGLAYYTGYGVQKNLLEAEAWLKRALASGHTEAAMLLTNINVT